MVEQTVRIGNAIIVLTGNDDFFNGGYTTGYLEFYDEHHSPPFPLTSHVVCDHHQRVILL